MRPLDGGPFAGGGIQFESTLILLRLSNLPYPRPYMIGIYRNPAYHIYRILSLARWPGILWT